MKIDNINSSQYFQAKFANDAVTKNVLTSVKNDYYRNQCVKQPGSMLKLIRCFNKVSRSDIYSLSTENNKLIMTSAAPNKYRNFEPITDSLSESFMRLMGKFINLKSI